MDNNTFIDEDGIVISREAPLTSSRPVSKETERLVAVYNQHKEEKAREVRENVARIEECVRARASVFVDELIKVRPDLAVYPQRKYLELMFRDHAMETHIMSTTTECQ